MTLRERNETQDVETGTFTQVAGSMQIKYIGVLLCILGILLMPGGFAMSANEVKSLAAQDALNALRDNIMGNKIASLEIIYAEAGDPPVTTPEWLEEDCYYKLYVNASMKRTYLDTLGLALKNTTIQSANRFSQDLRWGIVFYNWKKERLAVVYISADGKTGVIGNSPVIFSGAPLIFGLTRKPPLTEWLTSNFSNVFR